MSHYKEKSTLRLKQKGCVCYRITKYSPKVLWGKKHPHSGVTPEINASLPLYDHHHVNVIKTLLRDLIKSDLFSFSITVRNFKTTL